MPHATNGSAPVANGDKLNSKFISHVTSYPLVSDSINAVTQNPYGKKSLEIADGAYQKFGKPVEPYLETPYSYAKPYVTKADELADSGLGHVDARFPIVKEDTKTIFETGKSYVFWPFKVADDSKNYALKTWSDEYEKTAAHNNRGKGVTTGVLAIVSTELRFASDFFQVVADFLGPKYEEGKSAVASAADKVAKTAETYTEAGKKKAQELKDSAEGAVGDAKSKAGEVQDKAEKKGEQLKQDAQKTKDDVSKKASK